MVAIFFISDDHFGFSVAILNFLANSSQICEKLDSNTQMAQPRCPDVSEFSLLALAFENPICKGFDMANARNMSKCVRCVRICTFCNILIVNITKHLFKSNLCDHCHLIFTSFFKQALQKTSTPCMDCMLTSSLSMSMFC